MPVISLTPSSSWRTDAMYSLGHSWAAMRPMAAASRTMAFSSLGTEPWPARPWARRRSHAMPFSAVCSR